MLPRQYPRYMPDELMTRFVYPAALAIERPIKRPQPTLNPGKM